MIDTETTEFSYNTPYFSQYGKGFQEKIFQSLMTDRQWASQMVEIMDTTFFDVRYLEYLCEKFFAYFQK